MIRRFGDGRDWFFEKRFGLFIHWGLYAIPAWHEQVLWRSKYKRKDYERLMHEFNPTRFDPNQWLDCMQEAGMEYLCFTTKHHDGFCMWNTSYTDYSIMNTPYGNDVLGILADACRKRGIPLGLYYSLPDWHHPNYPNLGRRHEMFGPRPGDDPDEQEYLKYVRNQVEEMCTKYGSIYEFFWDVNVGEFYDPSLNAMIRKLQPNAMINDRGPGPGDYSTPERHVPEGKTFSEPTEACQSMGRESWGYRADEDYHSHKFLIQSIDRITAMGGNYILNVGPKADGAFPEECVLGLQRIGRWYKKMREALCAAPCSYMLDIGRTQLFRYDELLLTQKGNTFYIHCYQDLQTSSLVLDCFDTEPKKAELLNDGRELSFSIDTIPWRWQKRPCLRVKDLPVNELCDEVLIVKLEFDERIVD